MRMEIHEIIDTGRKMRITVELFDEDSIGVIWNC